MGETPIFFTSHSKQTLEMRGLRTVTICTFTQDTRWATLADTVSADGIKLSPMLIFKGNRMVRLLQKSSPCFQLAVSTFVSRLYGWMRVQCLSELKNSQTINCNCTRKCCSTACVGFLIMSHDGIGHWFNPKPWCGG